ncbi:MAG: hypothetical protein WBG29_09735, partial [Candidatus Acidiferrales bacterium]
MARQRAGTRAAVHSPGILRCGSRERVRDARRGPEKERREEYMDLTTGLLLVVGIVVVFFVL